MILNGRKRLIRPAVKLAISVSSWKTSRKSVRIGPVEETALGEMIQFRLFHGADCALQSSSIPRSTIITPATAGGSSAPVGVEHPGTGPNSRENCNRLSPEFRKHTTRRSPTIRTR
jgi:hypothetical protein